MTVGAIISILLQVTVIIIMRILHNSQEKLRVPGHSQPSTLRLKPLHKLKQRFSTDTNTVGCLFNA